MFGFDIEQAKKIKNSVLYLKYDDNNILGAVIGVNHPAYQEALMLKQKYDGEDNMRREFYVGDIIRHFKYETNTESEKLANKYMYEVKGFATNVANDELVVVYQALYGDFRLYVRPYSEFMSRVDKEKYPDIKQIYRFERVEW